MITSHIMYGRTIITHKPFQKKLPYKEEVIFNVPFYCGSVLQRGYGLGSIFKSAARSVMPSLKEIGISALTTGLEVLQETSERKQSSFPRRYCF